MSQAPLTIDNVTHAAYRAADNLRAAALASFQSGNAAPANPVAGMFWLDTSTTPATLKQRNVANNAWGPPLLQFATGATPDTDTTLPLNKAVAIALFGSSLPNFAAGAAGQPRIEAEAFPDFNPGAVEIINFVMPPGRIVSYSRAAQSSIGQDEFEYSYANYQALKAGTLTASVEMFKAGSYTGGADGFRIYKNGALVAQNNATAAWATHTSNFSFSAGDLIQFRFTVSSTSVNPGMTRFRNLRLLGDRRGLFRI